MKALNKIVLLFLVVIVSSCKKDDPLVSPDYKAIKHIKDTEILLRNNLWGFQDMRVDVRYEMRAIPLLANVADENGMVQPGIYDSYAIYGNDIRQKKYSYQFTMAKVYRDTTDGDAFNKIAFYNVLSQTEIRLNPDSIGSINYTYAYNEEEDLFKIKSSQATNRHVNDLINKAILDAIVADEPNELADAAVDKLLNNAEIQAAIQTLLYDMVHGKIEGLTQNPETISQKLATVVLEELKMVDWETLLNNQLLALLEELQVDNPEDAALALATQVATIIETSFSEADIYDAILPLLENFENETLPALVPNLSQAIYSVISIAFTEENIYAKIYPAWISFSEIDSSEISYVADTLGSTIIDHFFDAETFATSLEPFIATLRNTSTFQIPALAQSIIDNTLMPLVDSINVSFPGMEIDPDWGNVKTVLSSALTVIKSSLAGQTDEQAASTLAATIISLFDGIITQGVNDALVQLQEIPADQASQVIAAWINNLVIVAEDQIVDFLENKLNELVEFFNAEEKATELAEQIRTSILEVFSVNNLYDLILPIMESLNDLDIEAVAEKLADWLTDMELIENNVSEEELLNALTTIISDLIGAINVDDATQKLVDKLMESNLIINLDGDVLKQVVELKIYEFLIQLEQQLNAIDSIEYSLERK